MKSYLKLTALGLALGIVSATSAATFSFSGGAGDGVGQNTLSFVSNPAGLTVGVTGWTHNGSSYSQVSVGQYSGGLGVKNSAGDNHTVDNNGNTDLLRFAFSSSVIVNSITIGYFENDSDFTYWITNSATPPSIAGGFHVGGQNSPPDTYPINGANAAGSYLWVSAYTGGSNDHFKLQGMSVTATVPDAGPTLALLGLGLIGLFGLQRRLRT